MKSPIPHEAEGGFRIESAEEHRPSEPLPHGSRFIVRLDTDEQKPVRSQPLVKLGKQKTMFLSRQVVKNIEGNDRVQGARGELKLHYVGAKQLGVRHVRLREVDLPLGEIDTYPVV